MANSIEEVRKFFEGDKYATEVTGLVIEKAVKGHSVVALESKKKANSPTTLADTHL